MNLEELSKLKYDDPTLESVLNFVNQVSRAKVDADANDNITILSIADLRPDVVAPSLPINLVLQNAKHKDGRFFVVPQVVE